MKLPLTLAAAAARLLPTALKKAIYRSGPLARLIRRALNRSAPNGLSQMTVAAGGLRGAKLLIELQMKKNYWLGTYEPELQQAVHDWLRPGMVVYDVGANIGYISLLLARTVQTTPNGGTLRPAGQVFAFEPLPANLERMAANFELNPWANITCVAAAVVDRTRAGTLPGARLGGHGQGGRFGRPPKRDLHGRNHGGRDHLGPIRLWGPAPRRSRRRRAAASCTAPGD